MKTSAIVLQWIIRLTGITEIVLGGLFWSGAALTLVPIHMLIGCVLVLALWVLSAVAGAAGVRGGPVALGFLWGVVVIALGLTQTRILVGSGHWIVRLAHLAVGLAAIGMGEGLTRRVKQARTTPAV